MPFAVYPALYRIWASCVVLPEPVSPMITTTVLLAMASRIGPSYWLIGRTLFFLFSSSSIAIPTMHNACSSKATGILQPFPAFARAPQLNPQKPVTRVSCFFDNFFRLRKKKTICCCCCCCCNDQCSSLEQQSSTTRILDSMRIKVMSKASRQRRFRA